MTISIKQTLRQDGRANPQDVLMIKKALALIGHYDVPDYGLTSYPDKNLFHAIKKYQQSAGLRVDGVITPEGETLANLVQDLQNRTNS
jgi:murein L,D-transpeptidase YcbB/YkuD